jgi:hypothetical protein
VSGVLRSLGSRLRRAQGQAPSLAKPTLAQASTKLCWSMRPTPLSAPTQKVSSRAAAPRTFGHEFAVGFLVGLGLLKGGDLRFGQDQAVPRPSSPRALSAGVSWSAGRGGARPSARRRAKPRSLAWPVRSRRAFGHEAGSSIAIAATAASISGGARFFKNRLAARHLLKAPTLRQLPAFVVAVLEPIEAVPAQSP